MKRYLLDTDTFSLFLQTDPPVVRNVIAHTFDFLTVSVISIREVWDGWSAAIARAKTPDQIALGYSRLTTTLNELRNWTVVSFTSSAIGRYDVLKTQKLNVSLRSSDPATRHRTLFGFSAARFLWYDSITESRGATPRARIRPITNPRHETPWDKRSNRTSSGSASWCAER